MATGKKINPNEIKMLVLDVDGVLTSGGLVFNADGSESKIFNTLDGHGLRLWKRAGLKTAFLSGRTSLPTAMRAKQLEIDYCMQECLDKVKSLDELLTKAGLSQGNIAYIGDDLPDLPVIKRAGFGVAVANAVDIVKQYADYVTIRSGGEGAVREVIEYILKSTGKWPELLKKYME